MGKTKINIVSGTPEEKKKSKLSYEEKRTSRAQKDSGNQVPGASESGNQVVSQSENRISSPIKVERAGEKPTIKVQEAKTHGKKYEEAKKKVEVGKAYPLTEAVKLTKETSYSKFPGSIELHLVVDSSNVNQMVKLPHSTGNTRKVEITTDETIEKLKANKIDFDVLLATPQDMAKLVPFAKLLGPRGLMPNPKNGTLIDDPKKAVANFGGNNIQLKTEKAAPLIHTVVGKTSMDEKEIAENTKAILETLGEKSVKKAVLSASMGPGIQVQVTV